MGVEGLQRARRNRVLNRVLRQINHNKTELNKHVMARVAPLIVGIHWLGVLVIQGAIVGAMGV
jgi:hypothetical protein